LKLIKKKRIDCFWPNKLQRLRLPVPRRPDDGPRWKDFPSFPGECLSEGHHSVFSLPSAKPPQTPSPSQNPLRELAAPPSRFLVSQGAGPIQKGALPSGKGQEKPNSLRFVRSRATSLSLIFENRDRVTSPRAFMGNGDKKSQSAGLDNNLGTQVSAAESVAARYCFPIGEKTAWSYLRAINCAPTPPVPNDRSNNSGRFRA